MKTTTNPITPTKGTFILENGNTISLNPVSIEIEYPPTLQELYEKAYNDFLNGIIPESLPDLEHEWGWTDTFELRRQYVNNIGFPIFTKEWLNPLAKFLSANLEPSDKILEVMAGKGFFSYALQHCDFGINPRHIITTDNFSWDNTLHMSEKSYTSIHQMDAVEAIKHYAQDTNHPLKFVLMSWPYMDDTAYRCLKAVRETNKQYNLNIHIIYIGEDYGGCTANDDFFDEAELFGPIGKRVSESGLLETSLLGEAMDNFVSWQGIHDCINLVV